ncbi:MAG: thiol oxidoreductase, partial [Gemmatimonadetes bacterium]
EQPTEETIGGKPIPVGVDPAPDPEITQETLDLADDFVRFLAPPTPLKLGKDGRHGRELFSQIGCATCHIPTLHTGYSPVPALSNQAFAAYTDLLLHDMGADLADICLGLATPADFRTEPLLDLRGAEHFLHDGRATTLEQAIELHGGEGSGARDRFKALSAADRVALVAFLKSL